MSIEAFTYYFIKATLILYRIPLRMIVTRETATLFEYYVLVRYHARHAHLFHLNCQNKYIIQKVTQYTKLCATQFSEKMTKKYVQ